MNVCDFINSKDMRTYLQEINYQFTGPEAAFVVFFCRKATLDEKIVAWQEIINTMPDCFMERRMHFMQRDSFHSFLKEYIALQKQDIQNLYSGDGYIYRYEYHEIDNKDSGWHYRGYDGWAGSFSLFFSDYASCIDYCKKEELVDGNVDKILIFRYPINQTADITKTYKETILLNNKMEIMKINVEHESEYDLDLSLAFEAMCFDFPTPFKRGDILVDCELHQNVWCKPFVLSYLTTWNSKEMLDRGFQEHECPYRGDWEWLDKHVKRILKKGDYTDMHAIGTEIDEEGNLYRDDFLTLPINLEYYREPLEGAERQLQVFSCYEKGEVDSELLTNCCFAIHCEEYSRKISQRCMSVYSREAMERVGML